MLERTIVVAVRDPDRDVLQRSEVPDHKLSDRINKHNCVHNKKLHVQKSHFDSEPDFDLIPDILRPLLHVGR